MKIKKSRSVFHLILLSMLTALCVAFLLLFGGLHSGKMAEQLNNNACDLMDTQTDNRKNYLENTLLKNHELSLLSDKIDSAFLELEESGQIHMDTLASDSSNCVPLLQAVSTDLIDTLRQKDITGIFIVFNTKDMDSLASDATLPGIYIRDLDPDATPSYRNSDLLLERSPIQLVQSMYISTDKAWRPIMSGQQLFEYGFVYPAFQAAYHDSEKLDDNDYGHITTVPYTLNGDDKPALAYSIPLVLPDGRVYGVLGVEMMTSYLQSMLPYGELKNHDKGTYLLANTTSPLDNSEDIQLQIAVSSSASPDAADEEYTLTRSANGRYWIRSRGKYSYASVHPLTLYNRNAPFSNEQWLLIGEMPTKELFSFSDSIVRILTIILAATLLTGFVCSVIFSRQMARPIIRLANELTAAKQRPDKIPVLSPTYIKELDVVSSAITDLGQTIVNTSTKFLQIMEMASIDLGGYEVRYDTNSVYVTDNFFELLGMEPIDTSTLTPEGFLALLNDFDRNCAHSKAPSGGNIYQIALNNGEIRYLHMKETSLEHCRIGVAEDETATTLERMRIEYERDYDSLTSIYNRRAFRRIYESLFHTPQQLKYGALLMLDLDNLKYVNDTFGHDVGDRYIRQTGQCILENLPDHALCGHISCDEFAVFLYGYDSQDELVETLRTFQQKIHGNTLALPNGDVRPIRISGGVSWYPEHATDPGTLKKYADFALYQMKKGGKGSFVDFQPKVYQHEIYVSDMRREFYQMIEKQLLTYHFQPIVSAVTGQPKAYEALMRVNLSTLHGPDQVLQVAREESRLHDIERLTIFKASESFQQLKVQGHIHGNELLFINSISSQVLTEEEGRQYVERYSDLMKQIVVEITEEENLIPEILEQKRKFPGFSGIFALDDYGSGYSNDKTLLQLSPHYIKLDLSIIRNIDTDINKQQLVSYIISYAHLHDIQIIAEGLETADEVKKVLELGADLLQGYFLARPEAVPGQINPEAVKIITEFQKNRLSSI